MNTLSEGEQQDGWQLLFDGKSLQGWHCYNKNKIGLGWQVLDNTVHFNSIAEDAVSKLTCNDIATDQVFADFHLKLDWKISLNGNSGIMFHVQEDLKYKTPWVTGPEMQILDNEGHRDGQFSKHRAGDLYDLIACSTETVRPAEEWNKVEIIIYRGSLTFILNDVEVVSTALWDDNWNKLIAGSKFKDM